MGRAATVPPELNSENIVAFMRAGRLYDAWYIAARFKVKTEVVVPFIKQLLLSEQIVEVTADPKSKRALKRYKIKFVAEVAPVSIDAPFAIPTRPVHVLLTGELKGYESEITRRTALCMLARGVR